MNTKKSQKNCLFLLALLLVLKSGAVFAAFEWPWQQVPEQKAKVPNVTSSASSSPVQAQTKDGSGSPAIQINKSPAGASNAAMPLSRQPIAHQVGATPVEVMSSFAKQESFAARQNSFTIRAPQRNANYEEVVKMQAKLQDLIHVTSEIDRLNRSKMIAVQTLVDKARVNQNLLKTHGTPGDTASKLKKSDAVKILQSKKLRVLREEAEKQMAFAQSHKESVSLTAQ